MQKQRVALTIGLIAGVLLFSSSSQADLLGFWEFEEGSGIVATDSSGQGNDGAINNPNNGLGEGGSVWVMDEIRGSVISFDGTADGAFVFIGADTIPVLSFDVDFTWAFWTRQTEGKTENNIIVGNRMSVDAVDFTPRQFIKCTPTKFEYHTEGNGNDNLDYADIPDNAWVHHVVVKKGTLLTYYRNGVAGVTHTVTQELYDAQPLFFGGDNEGAEGEKWQGYLDNVRIYNEALSAQAVADLYNSEALGSSDASNWELLQ